ncbi:MAG: hypothetical protein ING19_08735 [Azospirillum sp.]|nr:hypothetical protein [Azospirillum sp.]
MRATKGSPNKRPRQSPFPLPRTERPAPEDRRAYIPRKENAVQNEVSIVEEAQTPPYSPVLVKAMEIEGKRFLFSVPRGASADQIREEAFAALDRIIEAGAVDEEASGIGISPAGRAESELFLAKKPSCGWLLAAPHAEPSPSSFSPRR